jgi:hypothetical protein
MNVGDLQKFVAGIEDFVNAHQGKKIADDLRSLIVGLEPFKERTIAEFIHVLCKAEAIPVPEGVAGKAAGGRSRAGAAARVVKKTKADLEAIERARGDLEDLYNRATDAALTYPEIEMKVKQIQDEFDAKGFMEVAKQFGCKATSGTMAKEKIEAKIKERKGRNERSNVIIEAATRASSAAEVVEAIPVEP